VGQRRTRFAALAAHHQDRNETDHILDRVHRFTRHFLRAGGPIRQHRVDRRRIGKKPFW
jgi:hypothetical protein